MRKLVARWRAHVETLWRQAETLADDAQAAQRARRAMARTAADVRRLLERRDASPSALPAPSRQAFATLSLLAEEPVHARAIAELAALHAELRSSGPVEPARVTLHLSAMRGLWRRRTRRGHSVVRCHVGFVGAGAPLWTSLARSALGHDPDGVHQRVVREEAHGERFVSALRHLGGLRGDGLGQSHDAHDLEASFERVNEAYFGGAMPRPVLRWSGRETWRKFGHFDFLRDELVLSSSLDDDDVPAWVVDFVMYHELLHKVHGIEQQGTRRIAHTRAFRRDERRYAHYEAAEAFLEKLSVALRAT